MSGPAAVDGIGGLDAQALDRARVSRDPRFDGKFFIAVTSTGIYCRPICPVRSPNRAHIRYYRTAAAAAEAGFRPCLRCRPEAAPGTPAWIGTCAIVRRALRLIDDGCLDHAGVEALAAQLGIGARHLDRLFAEHVGASPLAVARNRRLHFAKRLLDETGLPITEIALAAGFGSVRRFNDAFRRTYARPPRDLRRRRTAVDEGGDIVLRLSYRPPYDWSQVRSVLAACAVPGVERVDERGYARTIACAGGPAYVFVQPSGVDDTLTLRVRGAAPVALFQLSSTTKRMFDLEADPARIASAFAHDPVLAPLVRRRPGVRIPGAWDAFECAVGTIIDEESTAARRIWLARLVAAAGRPIADGALGLTHLFPSPAAVAAADLAGIGLPPSRVKALRALAHAVLDGLDMNGPAEGVRAALSSVAGVGARTAERVALRALGEPDAFPVDDRALQRAVGAAAPSVMPPSPLEARADSWRPWRGYAAALLGGAPEDVL